MPAVILLLLLIRALHQAHNAADMRARRAANPEKYRQQCRAQRAARSEHYRARGRARYHRNAAAINAKAAAWRKENPEHVHARDKRYHLKYAEKAQQYRAASYPQKKDEINARRRTKYAENPEEGCQIAADWRANNLEKSRAIDRKWKKTHREVCNAQGRRRRARKKGAPIRDLTHAQWLEIQAAQTHRCYYCRKPRKGKLTQDHLTPLSGGGSHTLHNVIAACHSCNSRKGTRKPPVPVQPLLLTVAPAKKRKAS